MTETQDHDLALHTIEICAGVGMLGEGLRAGLAHLGITLRTVCYLEREAYPAACLAARSEEDSLDGAPVWSDLLTFDARRWAGAVDGIAAGFPCQDLSLAGKRAGLDGKRSGLFFDILEIAHACGAWFLFLENVAGIATATASVVDEAEGALEERAAARVLGELADRGWHAEWLTLSASDVGASHGRERWFCFAWRDLGHPESQRLGETRQCDAAPGSAGTGRPGAVVADAAQHGRREGRPEPAGKQVGSDAAQCGSAVADTERVDCQRRREPEEAQGEARERQRGGPAVDSCSDAVADPERQGLAQRGRNNRICVKASERDTGPDPELHSRSFFAPGPTNSNWPDILRHHPEHAPALEPAFCGVVDGVAFAMDESRAQRLKCVGNGVVALQAAAAFVLLARRAGLG